MRSFLYTCACISLQSSGLLWSPPSIEYIHNILLKLITGLFLGQRADHRVLQIDIQSLRTRRDFREHDHVRKATSGWLQLPSRLREPESQHRHRERPAASVCISRLHLISSRHLASFLNMGFFPRADFLNTLQGLMSTIESTDLIATSTS